MKSEKSHHIFLFEPLNDSPISVLWDLVLAFYVVRLAALYSLLTLSSHLLLSHLAPSTTTTTAITTLLAAALWTRYVMQRWQVPPAVGFRGAVGLLAGGMIWVVEEVLWGVGYEFGYQGGLVTKGMGGWVMAGVVGMPVLMGGVEGAWEVWGERRSGRGLELGRSY